MGNPNSSVGRASSKLLNRTNICGGNKKPGNPSTVGKSRQLTDAIQRKAWSHGPFIISSTNVLSGGVGRHQSMFRAPADSTNMQSIQAQRVLCMKSSGKTVNIMPM